MFTVVNVLINHAVGRSLFDSVVVIGCVKMFSVCMGELVCLLCRMLAILGFWLAVLVLMGFCIVWVINDE